MDLSNCTGTIPVRSDAYCYASTSTVRYCGNTTRLATRSASCHIRPTVQYEYEYAHKLDDEFPDAATVLLLPLPLLLLPIHTAYRLLPTAYYTAYTAYCLLPTAYTAYCLLPTAYCLLMPTDAYCLLPTAYCLLPTAYCLLPTTAYD